MNPPVSMDDVDDAFAAVADRRARANDLEVARRRLWRTHHWPHRYERCAVVAGRHVCRRCLWFYSIALLTMLAAFAGLSPWPTSWDGILVWVLSVPATIEFAGGELAGWRYDPKRQVAVTSILGLAVGRGFAAAVETPGSPIFWGPAIVFGSVWFAVAVLAWMQHRGQYREDVR